MLNNNMARNDVISLATETNKLGNTAIIDHSEFLQKYRYSGLSDKPIQVRGVVFPKSTSEISEILTYANQRYLPVYPISRGKNWGYGTATPNTDDCFIMDLSQMDQIVDVDKKMAIAEIEPGVTQDQLSYALAKTHLMMDVTGAGGDTSLMGNVLERGFGHTPLGFRSQHFIISEMVLADGTIIDLADSQSVARYGRVGLASGIHELMQQSNFAVITKMRIMLMPRPEVSLKCIFSLDDNNKISEYIDAVRQLKEEGVFDGLPHIGNDMRILSLIQKFDFENWNSETGLSEQMLSKLRQKYNVSRWTLACGIYGTKEIAQAKANRARKILSKIGTVQIISDQMLKKGNFILGQLLSTFPSLLKYQFFDNLQSMEKQSEMLKLFDGYPTDYARKGCYWRNRSSQWKKGADPVADGCGFRWIAPTLPLTGEEVERLIKIAKHQYQKMGFEFAITLTAVNSKLCQAILSIYYDMDNAGEISRARQLAANLKKDFDAQGWKAYRIAIDESEAEISSNNTNIINLRSRIKQAFDPRGIIAPGRYCPIDKNESERRYPRKIAS